MFVVVFFIVNFNISTDQNSFKAGFHSVSFAAGTVTRRGKKYKFIILQDKYVVVFFPAGKKYN